MICPRCFAVAPEPTCRSCGGEAAVAVLRRDEGAQSFFLLGRDYSVGRETSADISVPDPSMSKLHMNLVFDGGRFVARDCESHNGIVVNGIKADHHALADGDVIVLGDTRFTYFVPRGAAAAEDATATPEFQGLLLSLLEVIGSTLVLSDVLSQVLDAVLTITASKRGCVVLCDGDGIAVGSDFRQHGFEIVIARPMGLTMDQLSHTILKRSVTDGNAVATADAISDPNFDASASIVAMGLHTVVCAPLIERKTDRVIGWIYADNQAATAPFSQACTETLAALGRHAAMAISNARLYEGRKRALAELRKAQAQLVESEKLTTIGQMSAGIVHELKNPLTWIGGTLEFLRAGHGKDDPEKLYEQIAKGTERISEIVTELTRFVRSSTGDPEELSLEDVVRRSLSMCHYETKAARVRTSVVVHEPVVIAGIRGQLELVFTNLIVNAARVMVEQRGGQLDIEIHARPGGAEVVVRDTGPGMPPDVIERMFEPFFTTSRSIGPGSGLGLSTVLMVVKKHGGRIDVDSRVGEGTTFRVFLAEEFPDARVESQTEAPSTLS